MGIKDLFITPIYIVILTLIAYFISPYVTNSRTRKYFLPALWARFAGAIALGLIYQFYYGGGDTFGYFEQGKIIYDAFLKEPLIGLKLLFADGSMNPEIHSYASRIYWYRSAPEFTVIKIASFFSLLTLNTYTAVASFFAFFSFVGSWLMFSVFQNRFPNVTNYLSYAILFLPSCVFWGSGILKDTLTLGALGILVWGIDKIVFKLKMDIFAIILSLISAWLIYQIKIYILLCFIPSAFLWWYLENVRFIKSLVLKVLIAPLFLILFSVGGYYSLSTIASTSDKYNLDVIAERAYITSYDIRYFTGKNAGSGYDIGAQDGTWQSLAKLMPAAINVSLFRPYLWEVRNPLMVFSALEAFIFLILTIKVVLRINQRSLRGVIKDPLVIMSVFFAVSFAFAVGVSSYNFGSLSRYKIPLLPFYASVMVVISSRIKQ